MAKGGCLSVIANIIWFFIGGVELFISWALSGVVLCITIIGIPFGLQCFKIAVMSLCPFGKSVSADFSAHPIMNVLWIIIFGWANALYAVISGCLLCITIIGIPFGVQVFKLVPVYLMPFGAKVN